MRLRFIAKLCVLTVMAASLIGLPTLEASASAAASTSKYDDDFAAASQEFGVPENLLQAIAYSQSRWNSNHGKQSIDGGYGIMDLTTKASQDDDGGGRHARGDWNDDSDEDTPENQTHYTLDEAAKLLDVDSDTLKHDQAQNIRGAAAVLAQYAKDHNDGKLPTVTDDWYDALLDYSGAKIDKKGDTAAEDFADAVFETMEAGIISSDEDGKPISIGSDPSAHPKKSGANNQLGAECPAGLNCRFVPAGYAANSADPTDYGNYDAANRPTDMKIQYIIIHDTEGSYDSAIKHFQDTKSYVTANYIIRSSDGAITQMVHNQDVSWGAGDWYVNMHAISIEHEGFAAAGQQWYSDAMYDSSAQLVRWLAEKYNIPLDRDHILGHDNVPATTQAGLADQHWDPGPYWDWNKYMDLVRDERQDLRPAYQPETASLVVMAPDFATNRIALQDCSGNAGCVALPEQATNLVFLHTAPDTAAPLLTDVTNHPDGAPGTTSINDWSATATTGQRFVVAESQGDWVAVWYGGQKGWFINPEDNPVAFEPSAEEENISITPANGTAVPVYGRPTPEADAYPAGVTPVESTPLNYTIPAGQAYPMADDDVVNDYYYDKTVDYSQPHDHEIFIGDTKYYQIMYNHRVMYVKAEDVVKEN